MLGRDLSGYLYWNSNSTIFTPYRYHPVAHFPSCPLSIPNILTTSTKSSLLIVVASPLLSRRHLLSIYRCAASALRCTPTGYLLLLPVASCSPPGCHVTSCRAATLRHLSSRRHLTCPSSTPCLHLHRLVVASHLVALPPPPALLSTLPPLNVPPPHVFCLPLVCLNWLLRCLMWHLCAIGPIYTVGHYMLE